MPLYICRYHILTSTEHFFIVTYVQGYCYDFWSGFDGCPVVFATDSENYCRTEAIVNVRLHFR